MLTQVVMVTAHDIEFYRERALQAGAHDIASKSDFNGLLGTIRTLLHERDAGGCK
jgi:DNA-binding NarL/FixJ family response regulator